jgi:hypothetical protein
MPSEFHFDPYWRARLGRKVSLRFKLHGDPEHAFSEAIGMVASVEGEGLPATIAVVNRRGETTVFAAGDVIATKDLPGG